MSMNGPLSGIRFSGLASGIDVESIVTQLMAIESQGISRLQAQQAQLQARQTVYTQFRGKLNSLNTTLSKLSFANTYTPVKATSSATDTVGVTAGSNAVAGQYQVEVKQLATAQKATSAAQQDATTALGMAGDLTVNGKAVSVAAGDTLNDVASKINSANAGVIASVLNGGEGNTFLVLTASQSGAANKIQIADMNGSVASSLGMLSGGATVRDAAGGANTARTFGFSSDTTDLGQLFGLAKSGTVTLGEGATEVSIDFATDSLQDIAAKINAAGEPGVSATVVTSTVNGKTVHQLQLSGADIPGSLVDNDGVLESLGVLQREFSNELVEAQDAEVVIDNLTLFRSTNTVTGVIQDVTLNLEKVGTSTVTLSRDTNSVKNSIKELMAGFNDVIDYIRANSGFDDETFASGPLFGDRTASQVEAALNEMMFSNLGTGAFRNFTDLGFRVDEQGKLTLDETRLSNALESDLQGVRDLLMATGSSANPALKYVSSGTKSVASPATGYAVEITQAATLSLATAEVAKSLPNVGGEVLTFGGTLFGSSPIQLTLDAGSSLTDIVTKINNDSRLKNLIVARDNGGTLEIESRRFGTAGRFTVTSNLEAGADTSGVGMGPAVVDGMDVAGTINGETATGNGQFLLGNSGNASTDGLQIQYTGNTTGLVGSFVFNRGLASLMNYRMSSFTDGVDGLLSVSEKTITDQITDIDERINAIREQLSLREQTLRLKFSAMEQAIAQLNAQSSQLASMFTAQSNSR